MTAPGLAYWSAAIEDRTDIDPEALRLMVAHPRFAEACWTVLAVTLERYRSGKMRARFARDISRLYYGYLVVYLDALGGVTLTAIQDICRDMGLASAGRARAILIHLRAIGYVRRDPVRTDRRSYRYVPSPEMQAVLRQIFLDQLQAFSLIEPEVGCAIGRFDEPDFYRAFLLRFGRGMVNSVKIRPTRDMTHFTERNAGALVLYEILVSAGRRDVFPPREELKMSVTELAQKFNVSRSHVFRLLRDAEELGLLKRDPDAQTGTLEERLARDLVELQVIIFTGLAACCHHAVQTTRAQDRVLADPAPA